jgi:hypothetical protein
MIFRTEPTVVGIGSDRDGIDGLRIDPASEKAAGIK